MEIVEIKPENHDWICNLLTENWGSPKVITKGKVYYVDKLPGFIAIDNGESVGLITYSIKKNECEIVSLNAAEANKGIGKALVQKVIGTAKSCECQKIWLVTTNDNTNAMLFYQKIGFEFVAIYRNALDTSRKLKPSIPQIGMNGIPLKDEIEFEMFL